MFYRFLSVFKGFEGFSKVVFNGFLRRVERV